MKKILGLRVSTKEFSYAVLTRKKKTPVILRVNTIKFPVGPKNLKHGKGHKWFSQEIERILGKFKADGIVIKKFEGRSKGNSYELRVEFEGIAFLVGGEQGIPVFKKPNVTLAKALYGKGKASYLKTKLDTSVFPDFENYKEMEKDAILCAWSEI